MSMAATASWPKRRLQIRSILSATMPIGWLWVAATALIPYFLIGRGRGAGSIEFLGITRTTWLGFHVWSSIVIGLLTIGHVVLNRRGLTRSYRILSGVSHPATQHATRARRGIAWLLAAVLLVFTIGGSWAFAGTREPAGSGAAVSSADHGNGNGMGGDVIDTTTQAPGSGSGNQHRGGRGGPAG